MRPRQLSHQWRDISFLIQGSFPLQQISRSNPTFYPSSTTKEMRYLSGLKVETLQCEFFYNGTRIPDPAPDLSVEQVRETPTFPEIATATLEGPTEDTGDRIEGVANAIPSLRGAAHRRAVRSRDSGARKSISS
jgi:PRTRC genetic system protein C